MRRWTKILAWIGVGLLGLGVVIFIIGPALFASVAYPLPAEYVQTVCDEAKNFNVKPEILEGLVFTESHWNANAQSGAGAVGLTQFIPSTARAVAKRLGVSPFEPNDLKEDPRMALRFGAHYIANLISNYGGDERKALIAYNGGNGAVIGYEKGFPFRGTLAYANKVLSTAEMYRNIYGDHCNRPDLPDVSAKSKSPVDLITTLSIPDFWRSLLFNRDLPTNTTTTPANAPDTTNSFWKNLLGN